MHGWMRQPGPPPPRTASCARIQTTHYPYHTPNTTNTSSDRDHGIACPHPSWDTSTDRDQRRSPPDARRRVSTHAHRHARASYIPFGWATLRGTPPTLERLRVHDRDAHGHMGVARAHYVISRSPRVFAVVISPPRRRGRRRAGGRRRRRRRRHSDARDGDGGVCVYTYIHTHIYIFARDVSVARARARATALARRRIAIAIGIALARRASRRERCRARG
jgi:hypothetical protein